MIKYMTGGVLVINQIFIKCNANLVSVIKNKIIILLYSFPYLCNSVFMLCANFCVFIFMALVSNIPCSSGKYLNITGWLHYKVRGTVS